MPSLALLVSVVLILSFRQLLHRQTDRQTDRQNHRGGSMLYWSDYRRRDRVILATWHTKQNDETRNIGTCQVQMSQTVTKWRRRQLNRYEEWRRRRASVTNTRRFFPSGDRYDTWSTKLRVFFVVLNECSGLILKSTIGLLLPPSNMIHLKKISVLNFY